MLFPVQIKRYLIYKNVDFALFISIRKIILTANNSVNYTNLCRTCATFIGYRVRNDESKAFNVYQLFYQILVFQTFENITFLYLNIYKQPTKYNESDKKRFLNKGNLL